jgi:carbonic anhydrase
MHETIHALFAGNDRHVNAVGDSFDSLQESQHPDVVTVCCGDSRVLQDGMWDNTQVGHVFTHSNIGNRVTIDGDSGRIVTGDVLYPLLYTDTQTAVVVGHTGCGAVTAAYRAESGPKAPGIESCLGLLEDDLRDGIEMLEDAESGLSAIHRLVEYNVDRQIEQLQASPEVPDEVTTIGVVYDFHDVYSEDTGTIHIVNVDGITETATLQDRYPEFEGRINRLWEY